MPKYGEDIDILDYFRLKMPFLIPSIGFMYQILVKLHTETCV